MKKSFTLLITIFLISVFSFLLVYIFQTKSLQSQNIQNQYLFIQGNNHKNFLKSYLKKINLDDINEIEVNGKLFLIKAFIKKINLKYEIDIFIKAKNYDIRIHEKFIK